MTSTPPLRPVVLESPGREPLVLGESSTLSGALSLAQRDGYPTAHAVVIGGPRSWRVRIPTLT